MQARQGTIVCKFGGDPAICLVEEAICAKSLQTDGRTDRQTDGRTTDAARLHKLIPLRNELKTKTLKSKHFQGKTTEDRPTEDIQKIYFKIYICLINSGDQT